jgi:hypothetical protein
MGSFLEKVICEIDFNSIDLGSTCFILPNKRSSKVFKKLILENISRPAFAPIIESIDTSNPVIHGLAGCEYEDFGLNHKLDYKVDKFEGNAENWQIVLNNVKKFREQKWTI